MIKYILCIVFFILTSCNKYYTINETYISSFKRFSPMKDFGEQPPADGSAGSFASIRWNYQQLIDSIYEPLRNKYPTYIERESLGYDSSGEYEIYAYTFQPRYYQQSIILVSGMHADEEDAIMCLARIMQLIADSSNNNDEDLIFLRQNIKITVIPVVNIWGFSQDIKSRMSFTGEKVQQWNKDNPINEVYCIREKIRNMASEVSFIMDMHTTTRDTYKDFYGIINRNDKNVRTIFRVVAWLCEQFAKEGDVDDQYLGYVDAPHLLSSYFHDEYGLTTSTMELSDFHWDINKGTSTVMSLGVTMFLNYIIQQVNDSYVILHDIPEEDYRESLL